MTSSSTSCGTRRRAARTASPSSAWPGSRDVHETFGGGIGQIALHGTNRPELIGQAVSNGCIRMTNEDITQVEALAAVGTPVTIVA